MIWDTFKFGQIKILYKLCVCFFLSLIYEKRGDDWNYENNNSKQVV